MLYCCHVVISADASTLDSQIALYQLNARIGHPCKVIGGGKFGIAYLEGILKGFCAYEPNKTCLESKKMNTVQYVDD